MALYVNVTQAHLTVVYSRVLIHCMLQEFDKVPMFMKTAPEEIDPLKHPDLACIQSIIHDDDRTPEGGTVILF